MGSREQEQLYNKLYEDDYQRRKRKFQLEQTRKDEVSFEEVQGCTFHPEIN